MRWSLDICQFSVVDDLNFINSAEFDPKQGWRHWSSFNLTLLLPSYTICIVVSYSTGPLQIWWSRPTDYTSRNVSVCLNRNRSKFYKYLITTSFNAAIIIFSYVKQSSPTNLSNTRYCDASYKN